MTQRKKDYHADNISSIHTPLRLVRLLLRSKQIFTTRRRFVMETITELFPRTMPRPHITLIESREHKTSLWDKYIAQNNLPVYSYHGEFGDFEKDALVIPIGSDGCIPKVYVRYFGDPKLEQRFRAVVRDKHDGKLLLGQAAFIASNDSFFPYLIFVPIQRVDGVVGNEPTNAYMTMRAVLDVWRFGIYKRKPVRHLVKTMLIPILAPESGSFSLDTVVREQFRALAECFAALSIPRRQTPLLQLVTDKT